MALQDDGVLHVERNHHWAKQSSHKIIFVHLQFQSILPGYLGFLLTRISPQASKWYEYHIIWISCWGLSDFKTHFYWHKAFMRYFSYHLPIFQKTRNTPWHPPPRLPPNTWPRGRHVTSKEICPRRTEIRNSWSSDAISSVTWMEAEVSA